MLFSCRMQVERQKGGEMTMVPVATWLGAAKLSH